MVIRLHHRFFFINFCNKSIASVEIVFDAGPDEINIIRSEILKVVKKIENTIINFKDKYALNFSDCFVIGFSQGGIMTFELGHYLDKQLAGLAIISGRIIEDQDISNLIFYDTPRDNC
jgi:predicted esterase